MSSRVRVSAEMEGVLASGLESLDTVGQRVLMLIPDTTRTAPVGMLAKAVCRILHGYGSRVDMMVALGTHPPMPRDALLRHLETSEEAFCFDYGHTAVLQHEWDNPSSLAEIGRIPSELIGQISDGLMAEDVPLTVNRAVLDYDSLLVLGPVFPHEVAGFSGGSKYMFPGISGPEMINFFHWLGAVITSLKTIGIADNPVRRVIAEAAGRIPVPVNAISLVIESGELVSMHVGPSEESWALAAAQSAELHIVRKPRRYRRVLACAPAMYDDIWTGGKAMYKCEPIVEDGGELILYAPHIDSFSHTHGHILKRIGYHVRDYYIKQMDLFNDVPKAVMAISTYLKGSGSYEDGVEKPRIKVSLATAISKDACARVGLGYVDPASIDLDDWRNREDQGLLLVEKAGETLYLPNFEGG
ncbi:MAG: lactate racemase domain-containing protein [Armatimonadetes bacterium]|nr:lactate racemase domain-containing protein [Armatimonadota bacterium]